MTGQVACKHYTDRQPIGKHRRYEKQLGMEITELCDALHPWEGEFFLNFYWSIVASGLPGDASGKEPACQCKRHKRHRFNPWVKKIPWRKVQQPTPVFSLGETHGQRRWLAAVHSVAKSWTQLK